MTRRSQIIVFLLFFIAGHSNHCFAEEGKRKEITAKEAIRLLLNGKDVSNAVINGDIDMKGMKIRRPIVLFDCVVNGNFEIGFIGEQKQSHVYGMLQMEKTTINGDLVLTTGSIKYFT